MKLFGLTGGIACGKSTVEDALRRADPSIVIIDADAVVHAVQAPGSRAVRKIAAHWPQCVDASTLTLDRAKLSAIVFADRAQLRKLTALLNWDIRLGFLRTLLHAWWRSPRNAIVVLSLPLLYEQKMWPFVVSAVLVVDCDAPTQLRRLTTRNGYTEAEARQRIDAQMPATEKVRRADLVVSNGKDESLADVRAEAQRAVGWMRARRTSFNGLNRVLVALVACLGVAAYGTVWSLRRLFA